MEREIKEIARKWNVPPGIVEKDYVISVLLRHLWSSGAWRNLIFKGGTALRKVYFPGYRFSEDMDFNFRGESVGALVRALSTLKKFGSIEFGEVEIRERTGRRYNPGEVVGYELRVPFYFLRKTGAPAKIRMDLTLERYERMVLEPVERSINHGYSDEAAFSQVRVLAYSLEEIMAEKIRTIFQRTGRPRDIYDIWFLSSKVDMGKVLSILPDKFQVKGVEFDPGILERGEDIYRRNWEQLSELVGGIPEFDRVWSEIARISGIVGRAMEK